MAAFSGDEFDVKDWINKTFKHPEAAQDKEQYAQKLVMKLQLLIAKLNANLEEQSEHVCQTMPRIVREVESLQQESALLRSSMSAVQNDIDQVNSETGASMETLVRMDSLKQRIQATSRALKEADNWTTLTGEIEEALDNGELAAIAEKLNGIQSSLKILSHVPDYEDRVMHVEGLKNRLEALASPQLVGAFNASDAERSRFFVTMFADMERSPQLLKYYRKCVRARELKVWANLVMDDNNGNTVLEWTRVFFAKLTKHIQEQFEWFQSVFVSANPVENMIEILLEIYSGLDPRLDFCLDAGMKQQTEPLQYLIDVKQQFNLHLIDIDNLLLSDPSKGGTRSHGRMRELAKVFFAPFRPHVAKYGQMESAKLLSELVNTTNTSKDILDELRNIALSVPKLVASLSAASKRCCLLTEGCGYPALVPAMEDCVANYVEKFSNLMRRLEKRKAAAHSWNILQQSLTLNQTSGELLLSLEQMDMTLAMEFLEKTKPFLAESSSSSSQKAIQQHHIFLLEGQTWMKKLQSFHICVKQGTSYPIVGSLLQLVTRLCKDLQASTFSILFHPISEQLAIVDSPLMLDSIWRSSSAGSDSREPDMPDFSFSPQEYITQIGQYLMTLPQHLEPYMTSENPALARALQERVFPYCAGVSSTGNVTGGEEGDSHEEHNTPADFLLSCVARATCQTYQEHMLRIPQLTNNSTKQLYTDIGYLGDILEDLGHPLTEGLKSVSALLRLPPKEFGAASAQEPQKLVSAVRQMRNLQI